MDDEEASEEQNEVGAKKRKSRDNDDDESKKRMALKPGLRKLPLNHRSADDMEFDDVEYEQLKIREVLAHKHKEMKEENERDELDERSKQNEAEELAYEIQQDYTGKIFIYFYKDRNFNLYKSQIYLLLLEEVESNEENGSELDSGKSDELDKSEFQNEKWVKHFESFCSKLNKKLIDLKTFEKSIRALMVHLDPSKDEKNKARLCLLTEHLIEYYQSLFDIKSAENSIDMKVAYQCTSFIYELVSKYGAKSTKENPSIFLTLFRKLLGDLNTQYMSLKWNEKKFPHLNTVNMLL